MPIVYVPVLKRSQVCVFEESLPSPLYGRVSEDEWSRIMKYLNTALLRRRDRLVFRILAPFLIGNIMRTFAQRYVDRQVEKYLEKKNLILSHRGVHIHHPKERLYSGMDVSICIGVVFPINNA
ncbi:uncharacterized protein NEMAJ01_1341 [Nematocida major]|uniref:uncharacterized protein n=1 Tax=Nematocida major TaxID=1912982 RepID=UPI00200767A2|nr:uncharacterized protein NEMAJ01_1341 [Nematocida major]KAH9386445.1 hypothetical protein NEMAJ01_1341 [Nematocida major]